MVEKTNRRDDIIAAAADLFTQQGYSATTVREIAEKVGCAEAALYYHFKGGKRELLNAVFDSYIPDLKGALDEMAQGTSLHDAILRFGLMMVQLAPAKMERWRWILAEMPRLTEAERGQIQQRFMTIHNGVTDQIARFVDDRVEADQIAWLVMSAMFGYGQFFFSLDIQSLVDLPSLHFVERLAAGIVAGR
ncbi:MAG TPA: TetR/AcrR family transcriptional regulator [Aggregatilinea sp.]|uniref:TetR/AcrR family transcriptional regulator n=1 Tax=Aggregatilinea sp. TaxID=2806333 RepID=UPI002D010F76|nr:TetR/AcrR family transcriptional regulator [Aggregatilinea sp.]HML24897.1 TetR/AcrR family transcriptional regulator [Aggregatilinea sp.]